MILSYSPIGIDVRLSENIVLCLVIENPSMYAAFHRDLWNKSNSREGSLHLVNGDKELSFDKNVDVIWNILGVDINDSKILKKLYQEVSDYVVECHQEKLYDLHGSIISFLEKVFSEMSYDLTNTLDVNIAGLLKLYDVRLASEDVSPEDILVNYMKAVHRICRKEVFFIDGLKRYFEKDILERLYEFFSLEKLTVIDIEGSQLASIQREKTIIIDKDSCIIEL